MKLNIAKVIRSLDLAEYAEAYKGQTVHVWVNPDMGTLRRRELLVEKYNRMLKDMLDLGKQVDGIPEAARQAMAEQARTQIEAFNTFALGEFTDGINKWFAELWSQGSDPATHWTVEELVNLNEHDPALYQWMKNQSVEMLERHREREKKG